MTTREYFQNVLDAHISAEMDTASVTLIQKLDEKNAKRKATPTKAQREAAVRHASVAEFFKAHGGEAFTRDAVAEALGISPAQVTAACRSLVDNGLVTKSEVKIDKTKRVVYSLAE